MTYISKVWDFMLWMDGQLWHRSKSLKRLLRSVYSNHLMADGASFYIGSTAVYLKAHFSCETFKTLQTWLVDWNQWEATINAELVVIHSGMGTLYLGTQYTVHSPGTQCPVMVNGTRAWILVRVCRGYKYKQNHEVFGDHFHHLLVDEITVNWIWT